MDGTVIKPRTRQLLEQRLGVSQVRRLAAEVGSAIDQHEQIVTRKTSATIEQPDLHQHLDTGNDPMLQPISGRCLCGAITVTIPDFDGHVGACHCGMCRRWDGGPSFSVNGGEQMSVTGEEHMRCYSSSDWAERAFCARCGTHLFYRMKATGERYVWAGLFDELPGAVFDSQIYIDRKPSWYAFANETRTMTEAEVIANFAPQGE